jgi:ribosome biogenesis GTPase
LEGSQAVGIVTALRRGGCLVIPTQSTKPSPNAPPLPEELFVRPRGLLKQFDLGVSAPVAVGDEVEFIIPPVAGDGTYEGLLTHTRPRGSEFRRLHPSSQAFQTLAANIARVAVVASADQPPFRPGFVDRVWVCALASNMPLFLILNKSDLGIRREDEELLRLYADLGLPVVRTSAKTGENLSELAAWLAGERKLPTPAEILNKFAPAQSRSATLEVVANEAPPPVAVAAASSVRAAVPTNRTVFCGHSGVGKSSLLTTLAPVLRDCVAVGDVVHKTGKGAHTTTQVDMYDLPDPRPDTVGRLVLIDTPGVREFTPVDTDRRNLWGWFPEIRALQGHCRFSDCAHIAEAGCAVLAAMGAGKIHPRRHESYVRLYQTLPG